MKAAIVREAGVPPVYADFEEPIAAPGEQRIAVTAAALSPLVRSRASGRHYTSASHFPFVAGVDGVGRRDDGSRVYFVFPRAPHGAIAERTVVDSGHCIALPDHLDDVAVAALVNPGVSSWAALKLRAQFRAGETVLINGATGVAGQLAVQITRCLGAQKVIATGRNAAVLSGLGADITIPLTCDGDELEERFKEQFQQGIDVVIDYLWGMSAERLLSAGAKAGKGGTPIRFVQVGTAAGEDIKLPGALLRSSPIELMGSGIGSLPLDHLIAAIEEMLRSADEASFYIASKAVALSDIECAWVHDDGPRTVFIPG